VPGGRGTISSGKALEQAVKQTAERMGLAVRTQVRVGRRIWGAERLIDLVVTDPTSRRSLGIECKYQSQKGTTEEKLPAVVQDMAAWPIRGILVFDGPGFSANLRQFLYSTGRAIDAADLEEWLQLYFGIATTDRE